MGFEASETVFLGVSRRISEFHPYYVFISRNDGRGSTLWVTAAYNFSMDKFVRALALS